MLENLINTTKQMGHLASAAASASAAEEDSGKNPKEEAAVGSDSSESSEMDSVQEARSLLERAANNYLVSVYVEGDQAGLAYVDVTTSESGKIASLKSVRCPGRIRTVRRTSPRGLTNNSSCRPAVSTSCTVVG